MPNQKTEVETAIQSVEQHIAIDIFREFATIDGALQDAVRFCPARHEPAAAERRDELRVRLSSANEGTKDAATRSAEDAGQALHLRAKILAY